MRLFSPNEMFQQERTVMDKDDVMLVEQGCFGYMVCVAAARSRRRTFEVSSVP